MTDMHPHPSSGRAGFTLIEVMIAVIILTVGIMALLGSSAMVTRMIGAGRHSTQAVEVATRTIENLRRAAYATTPACTGGDFVSGTATGPADVYSETWRVLPHPSGNTQLRLVTDTVIYRTARGTSRIGLETTILCR